MKYLKNIGTSPIVLEGYTLYTNTYQLIDPVDYFNIGNSSDVLENVVAKKVVVSQDGVNDITDINLAINVLKDNLESNVKIVESKWYSDAVGYRARWKGYSGTATAGITSFIDFEIPEERFINGMGVITTGTSTGDSVSFQVIDKDGIYYPAGTVLDTFVDNWYLSGQSERQCDSVVEYPARILGGLYIRIIYNSKGTSDVTIYCNTKLHKVPS